MTRCSMSVVLHGVGIWDGITREIASSKCGVDLRFQFVHELVSNHARCSDV
jgi:hypothetical protein